MQKKLLTDLSLDAINRFCKNTLVDHLGIEFTEVGTDFLKATMPVDHRTKQPAGLLHGGASAALAETIGSMASICLVNIDTHYIVGIEINANHIRKVTSGFVTGTATLISKSRKLHIWDIKITNDQEDLVCISRLTVMVLPKND